MADTILTPKAQADAKKMFDNYDVNKSNSIEINELKALMTDLSKEIGIDAPTHQDVEQVKTDIDVNKDSRISWEESIKLFELVFTLKNIN